MTNIYVNKHLGEQTYLKQKLHTNIYRHIANISTTPKRITEF